MKTGLFCVCEVGKGYCGTVWSYPMTWLFLVGKLVSTFAIWVLWGLRVQCSTTAL